MDASDNQLQFPVMNAAIHVLSTLMQNDIAIAKQISSTIYRLANSPEWEPREEWIWQFSLANLFASLVNLQQWAFISDSLTQTMITFFANEYYPVQLVLEDAFISILLNHPETTLQYRQPIGTTLCSLLGSHNFLSEWCCALRGLFDLLRIVWKDSPINLVHSAVQRMFISLAFISIIYTNTLIILCLNFYD